MGRVCAVVGCGSLKPWEGCLGCFRCGVIEVCLEFDFGLTPAAGSGRVWRRVFVGAWMSWGRFSVGDWGERYVDGFGERLGNRFWGGILGRGRLVWMVFWNGGLWGGVWGIMG